MERALARRWETKGHRIQALFALFPARRRDWILVSSVSHPPGLTTTGTKGALHLYSVSGDPQVLPAAPFEWPETKGKRGGFKVPNIT